MKTKTELLAMVDRVTAERDAALGREAAEIELRRNHAARIHELSDQVKDIQQRLTAADERAGVLDAPACKECEGIGYHVTMGVQRSCWACKPAAKPQGEPVAWVECSPAWLKAGGDCGTAPRLCVGREGISHLHPAHTKAEQPAPVAGPRMCDCNQGRLPCRCKP